MPHQRLTKNSENEFSRSEQEHVLNAKRAVLLFVVFLIFQNVFIFTLSFLVGLYSSIKFGPMNPAEFQHFFEPFNLPIGIVSTILSATIIFFMTKSSLPGSIRKGAFVSLGWRTSSSLHIFLGLLVGALLAAGMVFVIIPAIPPVEGHSWGSLASAAASGGWQRFYWAIAALFVAPLVEEFIFRGILFTGMANAFGVSVSAIMVSIAFILLHIPEAMHYWIILIGISLLAIATVIFRIKTKSLFPAIAVHFGYNVFIVIFVYAGL